MTNFNKKLKELKRKQKSIQSKDLVVLKTWAKFEEGKMKTNVVESVKTKTHFVKKKKATGNPWMTLNYRWEVGVRKQVVLNDNDDIEKTRGVGVQLFEIVEWRN